MGGVELKQGITLQIANYKVHGVLIDTKSSVDVLFRSAYNQMGLLPTILKPVDVLLYEFSSHSIRPSGGVELLVTANNHHTQATILTNFLVMVTSSVYNTIIRRPTLNTLQAVSYTYHLALKFLAASG